METNGGDATALNAAWAAAWKDFLANRVLVAERRAEFIVLVRARVVAPAQPEIVVHGEGRRQRLAHVELHALKGVAVDHPPTVVVEALERARVLRALRFVLRRS